MGPPVGINKALPVALVAPYVALHLWCILVPHLSLPRRCTMSVIQRPEVSGRPRTSPLPGRNGIVIPPSHLQNPFVTECYNWIFWSREPVCSLFVAPIPPSPKGSVWVASHAALPAQPVGLLAAGFCMTPPREGFDQVMDLAKANHVANSKLP